MAQTLPTPWASPATVAVVMDIGPGRDTNFGLKARDSGPLSRKKGSGPNITYPCMSVIVPVVVSTLAVSSSGAGLRREFEVTLKLLN
jgi:hypothetical protein